MYTPSSTFVFSDTSYTPSSGFNFDGAVDTISGDLSVTLDDVTGAFVAGLALSGDISYTLEDAVGSFNGYVAVIGDISTDTDETTGVFVGRNIQNLGIISNIQLDDTTGTFDAFYDANTLRLITPSIATVYESATDLPPVSSEFIYEQASYTPSEVKLPIEQATYLGLLDISFVAENTTMVNFNVLSGIEQATGIIYGGAEFVYEQGTFIDVETGAELTQATGLIYGGAEFVYEQATKVYPDKITVVYQDSNRQMDFLRAITMDEPLDPYTVSTDFTFTDTNFTPNANYDWSYGRPDALAINHRWGVISNNFAGDFQTATFLDEYWLITEEETKQPERGKTPWVDLPRDPVDPDPPGGNPQYTVPIQEVYTMQNIINVTLDDGTTPIALNNINLSLDADSFTWSFSASLLNKDDKSLVTQNPDGTAKILVITINGYVWHVLVEKIVTTRTFSKSSISINGRGLTALLSKPYVQPVSVNFGSLLTVQQIADQILPPGWTNVWNTVTWNVAAGAYSFQNKTNSDALMDVATKIGAIIIPTRDSQEITFKPRYPVLPWNFSVTNPDIAITESSIIELSEEPVSSFQANGVYIHGDEIGGELALVRLNGTAGDRLAQTTNNELMTDVIALRSLGDRLLSGQYEQPPIKGFTTFMDGTIIPLFEIGHLASITIDNIETKGIVNGVSITASTDLNSAVKVYQKITMGDTTTNSWVAFNELLPKDPMLIATLSSTTGTTSLMLMIDGGIVRVRGTGTPGIKYYIRSGEIVSEAPDITQLADIVL